ncbi:MAG TPA: hypothetical protein PK156_48980, partial [Polyangium sp.]|nr:hypothetical protein [Polyangium sp.]
WRLRRGDAKEAANVGAPRSAEALSEPTVVFLQILGVFGIPLAESILDAIAPRPSESLETLERMGLIERTPQGLRLHELTRDLLTGQTSRSLDDAWYVRAGRELAAASDTALKMEGLRLLFESERIDEAIFILNEAGESLLLAGYATRLWKMLETKQRSSMRRLVEARSAALLELWRLRCAAELGDAEALSSVHEPDPDALAARYYWARLLHTKGNLGEAWSVAETVAREATNKNEAEWVFRAGLLAARCLANRGDIAKALERVEALTPYDPSSLAEQNAFRTVVLAFLGQRKQAYAYAMQLRRSLMNLTWPTRGHVGYSVALALYHLGRLRDARETMESALADDSRGSVRFDIGRQARYLLAAIAILSGNLNLGRALVASVEPYLARTSLLRPHVSLAMATVSLHVGDFADLDRRIGALREEVLSPQLTRDREAAALATRILRRQESSFANEQPHEIGSTYDDVLRVLRLEAALREGKILPDQALKALEFDEAHPLVATAISRIRSIAHLLAGHAESAWAEVRTSISTSHEFGYALREAEARAAAADVLTVLGRWRELAIEAEEIFKCASTTSSPRFTHVARLYRQIAEGKQFDPAQLEALAGSFPVAPDVALRSRALLGANVVLDELDRRVLDAFRAATGFHPPSPLRTVPHSNAEWTPAWGFDELRNRVWLPDGRTIDLGKYPGATSLLRCLIESGGQATKEELVLGIWNERSYHPLLHDNRLRAAILKLRRQIEDDPASPTRVLTTVDGYALAEPMRLVRRSTTSSQ